MSISVLIHVVVKIGFSMVEYNITEGMIVTVCVELRQGYLARDTTVMLSAMGDITPCKYVYLEMRQASSISGLYAGVY